MIDPRILEINLTEKEYTFYHDTELFKKKLGGIGVAIELLDKHIKPHIDPLSADNVIIFAIGPLNSFYPVASKTCAVFKSPLNGYLGESYAGGRLSTAMRFNNLGAIIIKGKSDNLTYFVADEDEVTFYNAQPLSNMYPNTAGRVIREKIGNPGNRSLVTIGPAGENMVKYACATVDRMRHFGRMGLGAVFGSKKLKGMAIIGNQPISLEANTKYKEYNRKFREVYKKVTETDLMAKYHVLGTPAGIIPVNTIKSLPTRNWSLSTFENAENISGENYADKYLVKRVACGGCPIGCIHLGILRERWDKGTVGDIHSIAVPYDYELIYALGSNLLIGDPSDVLRLIEAVEREGMDAISTGVVMSWLAEAYDRNIISPRDTKGKLIRFGKVKDFLDIIPMISQADSDPTNTLFKTAAEGVEALVEKYGGSDFGIRLGKVEPAGYCTGPFSIIGYSIGGRHSHLDNAGYSLDQKLLLNPKSDEEAIKTLMKEEEWRNVLNSLVICLFARNVYDIDTTIDALDILKIETTKEKLLKLGEEIQKQRLKFKVREGFSIDEVEKKLPNRFTNEMMTAHGKIEQGRFKELFSIYKDISNSKYGLEFK